MLHCDHQALRARLFPLIDLVDGADQGGHACRSEQPEPVPAARPGEPLLDLAGQLIPVCDPDVVHLKPLVIGVEPGDGGELPPLLLVGHPDLDQAVSTPERTVRRDRRVMVSRHVRHLAGHGPARALVPMRPDDGSEQ